MEDKIHEHLAHLAERMRLGEKSAFDAFARLLQGLAPLIVPLAARLPDWQGIQRHWVVSTALQLARPDFEAPRDLISWMASELAAVAGELAGFEDLQKRITVSAAAPESGIEVATARRVQAWVSGDFVDVVHREPWSWVVLGDASGHGPAAAYYSATVFATLRACFVPGAGVAEVVGRANDLLHRHRPGSEYATVQVAAFHLIGSLVHLVNAGLHVRPVLVSGGTATAINACGLALGWLAGQQFDATSVEVGPGDSLVLASDGVKEQESGTGEQFGEERIVEYLARRGNDPPCALAAGLLAEVKRHSGDRLDDDQMVVVVRRRRSEDLPRGGLAAGFDVAETDGNG